MKSALNPLKTTDISLSISAIVAGLGLLIMAVLAPIANFGILQKLIVSGDVTNTANNIIEIEQPEAAIVKMVELVRQSIQK